MQYYSMPNIMLLQWFCRKQVDDAPVRDIWFRYFHKKYPCITTFHPINYSRHICVSHWTNSHVFLLTFSSHTQIRNTYLTYNPRLTGVVSSNNVIFTQIYSNAMNTLSLHALACLYCKVPRQHFIKCWQQGRLQLSGANTHNSNNSVNNRAH